MSYVGPTCHFIAALGFSAKEIALLSQYFGKTKQDGIFEHHRKVHHIFVMD
jgi:hypothetical protein